MTSSDSESVVTRAPAASIVIRTLNEARWLPDLLEGIAVQDYPGRIELLLVDSGSEDGTVDIARRFGCRILTIDRGEFSFGRSLNRGCSAASGDVLVFVSGHCIPVGHDWLERLVAPLMEGAAYSYGRQIGGEITRFSEHKLFEKYFPSEPALAQGGYFCNNANAALCAEAWRAFGFDEALTGLEDLELAKRLIAAGHRVSYAPEAVVQHLHEESWSQVRRRYEREAIALQSIAPEIRLGWTDFLRYLLSSILLDLAAAAREGKLIGCAREICMFRTMQYLGAYRGNHEHRTLSRQAMEQYFYPRHSRKG